MRVDTREIRALLPAATSRPWFTDPSPRLVGAIMAVLDGQPRQVASIDGQAPQFDPQQRDTADLMRANATLICAAVNALDELCTELELSQSLIRQTPTMFAMMRAGACPCLHTTPCHESCTCASPLSSSGCSRCCTYGSPEQQRAMAEQLVAATTNVAPILLNAAIQAAVDDALGEVQRQCGGGVDSQIMVEARGSGVARGIALLDAARRSRE